MARHTLFTPDIPPPGGSIVIEGDEARHAVRVKRITEGDPVTLTDGRGRVAQAEATDTRRRLALTIRTVDTAPPIRPAVRVLTASPKGPRLEKMIDALSQVGAASWAPMDTKLGVVDPGANKMERSRRVALESAKQCGRAWVMDVEKKTDFSKALADARGTRLVLADGAGEPYTPTAAERVTLLIGPEGGWTDEELDRARKAGANVCAFGVHTMRIETAAAVACACIIEHETRAAAR